MLPTSTPPRVTEGKSLSFIARASTRFVHLSDEKEVRILRDGRVDYQKVIVTFGPLSLK